MIGTAGCYSRAILAIIENKTAMFQNIEENEKMIARKLLAGGLARLFL